MRRGLAFGVMLLLAFSLHIHAQKVKVPCYEGDQYQSCTPSEKLAKARLFARAKTVAVIVEAKRTVSCGDGSDDTCIVNDGGAIKIIQDEIGTSPLWDTFAQAEPKRADILLKFNTRNRGTLQLCAYDSETNDILWCKVRSVVSMDNDTGRLIQNLLDAWKQTRRLVTGRP